MRLRSTCALGLLAGALMAGCGGATPPVDQRQQTWLAQGITDYRIEVLVVNSVWHAQSHQIIVRNNQVESATATCQPAPTEGGACQVAVFSADDYTVAGLFAKAQAQTQSPQAEWTQITFEAAFGFPQQISYDDPALVDEDWVWRVTAFEVLR